MTRLSVSGTVKTDRGEVRSFRIGSASSIVLVLNSGASPVGILQSSLPEHELHEPLRINPDPNLVQDLLRQCHDGAFKFSSGHLCPLPRPSGHVLLLAEPQAVPGLDMGEGWFHCLHKLGKSCKTFLMSPCLPLFAFCLYTK